MQRNLLLCGLLVFTFLISSCVTTPPVPVATTPPLARHAALIPLKSEEVPAFSDDLSTSTLRQAVLESQNYYRGLPPEEPFYLGKESFTAKDMAESMTAFIAILDQSATKGEWFTRLKDEFVIYQSAGTDSARTVVFSSYYEPIVPARRQRDAEYQFPFYARPPDLVDVDLALFDPQFQGAKVAGRRVGKNLVPYYTRGEIDGKKSALPPGLELAWGRDAFDVLDMQIEGSGWLDFGDGEPVRIRYDGNNGKKYRSVGQYLISSGRIPKTKFSRDAMRDYLRKYPKERQKVLSVNERFIFFRLDMSTSAPFAFGNISVPLTGGRSMATDPKLFPKGALAWVQVNAENPIGRFMVNQDEGGAIQGPGRVDIFAGKGDEGLKFASKFWNKGTLYFLVKKKTPRQTGRGL